MTSSDLLVDAFERVRAEVEAVVAGLTGSQLAHRIDPDANSIGWLVWHLARVQDDHIAGAADLDQVWHTGGWADRFGLPFDPHDIGYGHSSAQVGEVRVPSGDLLTDYHAAVHAQTIAFVGQLTDTDLPRIVDERWDPPVPLGVRLVSVIGDTTAHVGQAAYVRGVVERTGVR